MIDSVMVNIGAAVMLIGGVALVAIALGLAVYAAGLAWIAASNKWRDILRAESLIYEYRMNREAYIEWREKANKAQDNAVPVVHCKDCKHYLIADEFNGGKRNMCEVNHFSYLNSDGDMHFCSYGERKEDA